VGDKPMILHPLGKLVEAGITEIMVVTSAGHMGAVMELLGSGKAYGAHLSYRVQDEPGGIAQALGLCERFVGADDCCVVLGDNIFSGDLQSAVETFLWERNEGSGALLMIKRVPDPCRYGVVEFNGKEIIRIVEKPVVAPSDYAVTGIYFYDSTVFEIIRTLRPSGRGELEITDVNNVYIGEGRMRWVEMFGEWTDAGTFASLRKANEMAQ